MKNKKSHKIKRFLAASGAFLLFAMYALTLVFALTDHSATKGLLKASIACTVILPVLLYAIALVYRLTGNTNERPDRHDEDA